MILGWPVSKSTLFAWNTIYKQECIIKERGEYIPLVYHPCTKFSGGQSDANMFEIACGQLSRADGHVLDNFCSQNFTAVR